MNSDDFDIGIGKKSAFKFYDDDITLKHNTISMGIIHLILSFNFLSNEENIFYCDKHGINIRFTIIFLKCSTDQPDNYCQKCCFCNSVPVRLVS